MLEPDLRCAQVLVGPRQVGKTWILWQIARHFLDGGWAPANVLYFDFSDERYDRSLGLADFLKVKLPGFRGDVPRLLLLDEITRATRWDPALKRIVDEARRARRRHGTESWSLTRHRPSFGGARGNRCKDGSTRRASTL